jgi:hypothetical protein
VYFVFNERLGPDACGSKERREDRIGDNEFEAGRNGRANALFRGDDAAARPARAFVSGQHLADPLRIGSGRVTAKVECVARRRSRWRNDAQR